MNRSNGRMKCRFLAKRSRNGSSAHALNINLCKDFHWVVKRSRTLRFNTRKSTLVATIPCSKQTTLTRLGLGWMKNCEKLTSTCAPIWSRGTQGIATARRSWRNELASRHKLETYAYLQLCLAALTWGLKLTNEYFVFCHRASLPADSFNPAS